MTADSPALNKKGDTNQLLARLLELHPKYIDLSLIRMTRLLDALGNPQNNLPPVIHIAGTNGKGSTLAYLQAMFEADGKSVHAYSSPHLVQFHERIILQGQHIDEHALAQILTEVEIKNKGEAITFFEATTAAALLAFSRTHADYLILEVGLGGRLDATNVIDAPALSLITPISMDHEHFLGDTLDKIAAEKAGILKPKTDAIIAPQTDAARAVICATAENLGICVTLYGRDWMYREEAGRLIVQHETGLLDLPPPALHGAHQWMNAALAALAATRLGITERAVTRGLSNMTPASWQARLQPLAGNGAKKGAFLPALLPTCPAQHIWLDGGHNPAAAAALADWIDAQAHKEWILICGMLNTKHATDWFKSFQKTSNAQLSIFTIAIPNEENSLSAAALADMAQEAGMKAAACVSLEVALKKTTPTSHVLICGSLYLAGYVLAQNAK